MAASRELETRCPVCASRLWTERRGESTLKNGGMVKLDQALGCFVVQCHDCGAFSQLDLDAMIRALAELAPIPTPMPPPAAQAGPRVPGARTRMVVRVREG